MPRRLLRLLCRRLYLDNLTHLLTLQAARRIQKAYLALDLLALVLYSLDLLLDILAASSQKRTSSVSISPPTSACR